MSPCFIERHTGVGECAPLGAPRSLACQPVAILLVSIGTIPIFVRLPGCGAFYAAESRPDHLTIGENHFHPATSRELFGVGRISFADYTAMVLDERRPGVVPLREMLRQAASTPASLQDENISNRYSSALLDLLVISLELQDLKTTHAELDLYGRIMKYIQLHLTEPDLSIEVIAQAHNVSTRTVTRAFARYQKTPVAEIWKERLNASREAIERGQVRSVSQAALDFGFSDFSHFSHAFRKAFGVAPNTLLHRN